MKKVFRKSLVMLLTLAMLLSSLGALSFTASAGSVNNLVTNGNFEAAVTTENTVPGFTFEKENYTAGTATISTDPLGVRSGKVLVLNSGATAGSVNMFRFYQPVAVEKNTDYTWEFYMAATGGANHYFGVVAGNNVKAWNTTLPVTVTKLEGSITLSANALPGGAVSTADGTAADPNWTMFASDSTWKKIRVEFNSGANSVVSLAYVARSSGRSIQFDDWCLYRETKTGEILNGDFGMGTTGYSSNAASKGGTFEAVTDTDGNSSLHVKGLGAYWQVIDVEANTDYILNFRMKSIHASGNTIFQVVPESAWNSMITSVYEDSSEAYGALTNGNAYITTYNQTWQNFRITFNSGANTRVKIYHDMVDAVREIYIDDFNLTKVGEIINPSFEDSNVLNGYNVQNITATADTTNVYSGTKSLKLSSTGTWDNSIFYQSVPVKANTDYQWTFWYKSTTPGKPSYVGVRAADSVTLLPSFIKSSGTVLQNDSFIVSRPRNQGMAQYHETLVTETWEKYVVTFNSGDNTSVLLTINMWASGRAGYIDDMSLTTWSPLAGDADNDGAVNSLDLTALRHHLVGTPAYFNSGADANENGSIDIKDLVSLKKTVSAISSVANLEGYELVWNDDFGTTLLDESKWSLRSHMSAQDDLEIRYDETAVNVDGGSVTLSSGRVDESNYYTNASLTTSDTMVFKYGYVEMRAKVPYGTPAFPSFWMKSASIIDPTVMGEIDIFEHFTESGNDYIQSGIHKWYYDEDSTHLLSDAIGGHHFGSEALAEEWHNYGLLWTPTQLQFMVDGVAYHTINITGNQNFYKYLEDGTKEVVTSDMDAFHDYFFLIMNNYLSTPQGKGDAGSYPTADTQFPIDYEIDYVRLYQKPGEGDLKILER